MRIRCSALPRVTICGASKTAPEIPIEDQGVLARQGSAVHGVMAECVTQGLTRPPDLSPYMHRWGLTDIKELQFLAWSGLNIWKRLQAELKALASEAAFESTIPVDGGEDIQLTGHPDILCEADGNILVVIDFKSGYVDTDYNDQLMGYVKLAWDAHPNYDSAKIVTAWLRDGIIEADDISRADLDAWTERLREGIASDDFNDGEHCMNCSRKFECPALATKIKAVINWLQPIGEADDIAFAGSSEALALRYLDTRIAKKAIGIFDDSFKDLLEREGRRVSDGAGKVLYFERKQQEAIIPDVAIDPMCEEFGLPIEDYEIIKKYPDLFTIPKTKYLNEVAAAVDSKKKQAKDEAWEALRKVHALRTSEKRSTVHKRGTSDPIPERS